MSQVPAKPGQAAIAAFLAKVQAMPAVRTTSARRGRLIFAVDATASRQHAWDTACHLQSEMFSATRDLGGLAVQLAYWRGYMEFAATPFLTDTAELARRMSGVTVLGGQTQGGVSYSPFYAEDAESFTGMQVRFSLLARMPC